MFAGLATAAGTASAVTIDFTSATEPSYDGKANIVGGCGTTCYETNNFVIGAVTSGASDTHFHTDVSNNALPNPDGSDNISALLVNDANGIYIRTANLSAFTLTSFDLDSSIAGNNKNTQGTGNAGPNAFWEIIGFNKAYNPGLDTFNWGASSLTAPTVNGGSNGVSTPPANLSSFGTVVTGAYQAVDQGFVGTVLLNSAFQNVDAVWIHYGNHSIVPVDSSKFSVHIDNINATAVAAVPVPAAVYLFGTGLMGFLALGKKRLSA